ncbi:MAG: transglutaminase-like domain-containing protein [Coriobacteriales bacterium]
MTAAKKLWGKAFALLMAAVLTFGLAGVASLAASTQEAYASTSISAVAGQCKGKSTTAKLKSLNSYMKKSFGYKASSERPKTISAAKAKTYAGKLCSNGKGSCVEWASLYAVAAKSATKCPVRIVSGTVAGYNDTYHCWVEVRVGGKWLVCDPLQEQAMKNSVCCKVRKGCKVFKTSTI